MTDLQGKKPILAIDADYITQHDLVQRYIRRTLTADELISFEIYLLWHPELIDEIEQQRTINAVFREELARNKRWLASSYKLIPATVLWRRVLPLAACMVMALLVGLNTQVATFSNVAVNVPTDEQRLMPIILQNFRGPAVVYDIRLSKAAAPEPSIVGVPFHIDVGPQLEVNQRYNLRIWQPQGGLVLATAMQLTPSADGWVDYQLDVAANTRGQFQVEVVEAHSQDHSDFQVLFQ